MARGVGAGFDAVGRILGGVLGGPRRGPGSGAIFQVGEGGMTTLDAVMVVPSTTGAGAFGPERIGGGAT